ncbi:hypothetical protein B0H13DRAFT_1919306 [Mycena leptocephala]|nr:hypothetical protein B0H13DRAFT_1919306 [Mycena leptocephala]
MHNKYFKEWSVEDELGIAKDEPDDGSGDDPKVMSVEDATKVGEATKKRKSAVQERYQERRRLQEVEIFQKRNKELVDAAVKEEMAKKAKAKDGTLRTDDNGGCSDDDSGSSSSEDDDTDTTSSSSDSGDDSNSNDDSKTKKSSKRKVKAKMDRKGRANAMRLRRMTAQKLLEDAPPEEKEIVSQLYREQKGIVTDDVLDKPIEERTPEEIQSALDELESILAEFHAGVYTMTGWLGITLLGGPSRREWVSDTENVSLVYCSGESPGGLTLAASLPDWETTVRGAGQWLKRCNPREVRRSRALNRKVPESSDPVPDIPIPSLPSEEAMPTPKPRKKTTGKDGLPKKPTKKEAARQLELRKRGGTNEEEEWAAHNGADFGGSWMGEHGDEWLSDGVAASWLKETMDPALIYPATVTATNPTSPFSQLVAPEIAVHDPNHHASPIDAYRLYCANSGCGSCAIDADGEQRSATGSTAPPQFRPTPRPLPKRTTTDSTAPALDAGPATPGRHRHRTSPPALSPPPPSSAPSLLPCSLPPLHPPSSSPPLALPAAHSATATAAPVGSSVVSLPPSSLPPLPPPSSSPPLAPPASHSATATAAPMQPLTSDSFPESRPMCKPPLGPRAPAGEKGRGAPGGRGGRVVGASEVDGAEEGGLKPPWDSPGCKRTTTTAPPSRCRWIHRCRPVALSSEGDPGEGKGARSGAEEAEVEAERTRKRHHNPAGGAPLVILLPLKPRQRDSEDASLELPEGSKRLRKPAQNRAMPVPLSDKSRKLSAVDAKAAKDDADLLKRLQASIHGTDTSKKRKAADENAAPPPKKNFFPSNGGDCIQRGISKTTEIWFAPGSPHPRALFQPPGLWGPWGTITKGGQSGPDTRPVIAVKCAASDCAHGCSWTYVYFVPPPGGSADGGEQDLNEEISTILLQVGSKLRGCVDSWEQGAYCRRLWWCRKKMF